MCKINNRVVKFELDTGTDYSFISKEIYYSLEHKQLEACEVEVTATNGSVMFILG